MLSTSTFWHERDIVRIAQWDDRGDKRLAFLRKLVSTRVIMLARSSKHFRFKSRTFWKNGTFSVHSCAMTIDIFKFKKNGIVCELFLELQPIL